MSEKKNNSLLLVFIIFLTSFLLGFIFCLRVTNYIESDLLKNYYNIPMSREDSSLDLSKYHLVYDIIKNNYYEAKTIEDKKLIESSIKGLVEGLGDKHSSYLDIEENTSFNDSMTGDFEGIGAVVMEHPFGVEIDRLIKGSPAIEGDLRVGDIVLSANSTSLEGMTSGEAVSHIKGEAGTNVELLIIRDGEMITKNITRKKITVPSTYEEIINDNMGYISVNSFGEKTASEFREILNSMKDYDGIIIDLRDNGGGYLMSAVEMLSVLVERGETLVVTKEKDEKVSEIYKSINNGEIYNGKIVVLINENTASASEIMAGALREYDKAILVGNKSYGKGSVQKPFDMADGSMLKLTIAKWFTPLGHNIDEAGITPDIEVNFEEEDFINGYDRQFEEAKTILDRFIELGDINTALENRGE